MSYSICYSLLFFLLILMSGCSFVSDDSCVSLSEYNSMSEEEASNVTAKQFCGGVLDQIVKEKAAKEIEETNNPLTIEEELELYHELNHPSSNLTVEEVCHPQLYRYKDDISFCYITYAANSNDSKICEKLGEKGLQEDINFCYNNFAQETGDYGVCEQIQEEGPAAKAICYGLYALNRKDYDICYSPASSEERAICFAYIVSELDDISLCRELDENLYSYEKIFCYGHYAAEKNDTSICEELEDKGYVDLCKEEV